MNLPQRVAVVEVGPRDGFQNEKRFIPTQKKVAIVNALSRAGIKKMEVTSAVHPKAVPQMADAEEVMTGIDRTPGVSYQVLAPNLKGVQRSIAMKPDDIILVMSASESHNQANTNCSVETALRDFENLVPVIRDAGIGVIGGAACVFGCPFEGRIPTGQVDRVFDRQYAMGIRSFGIGDTIGTANPQQVYDMSAHLLDRYPDIHISGHFHNTRGLALANILAAMQAGISEFDASAGGLGGCPFAPNASGNIATEDLVNMLTEMGIETGVNLDALLEASEMVKNVITHPCDSALLRSGKPWVLHEMPVKQ